MYNIYPLGGQSCSSKVRVSARGGGGGGTCWSAVYRRVNNEKGFFFKLGRAQRCHRLG